MHKYLKHNILVKTQNKERTQNIGLKDNELDLSMALSPEFVFDLDQLLITWKTWKIRNEYKDSVSNLLVGS